jgi:hypothetical protein
VCVENVSGHCEGRAGSISSKGIDRETGLVCVTQLMTRPETGGQDGQFVERKSKKPSVIVDIKDVTIHRK